MDPRRQSQRRRDLRRSGLTLRGLPALGPVTSYPSGRRIVGVFVTLLTTMIALSTLSVRLFGIRAQGDPPLHFRWEWIFEGLFRYDGGWYAGIAEHGYHYIPGQQSNVAYFPLYPMLMRAVGWIVGDTVDAGLLITAVAGCLAAVLAARWMRGRGMSPLAVTLGLAVLLVYPYSWYLYGVVYSDAVFLLAVVAASLAVESDRIVVAGFLTMLASADRPTGLSIAIGMTVLVAERRGVLAHVPGRGRSFVDRFRVPNRFDLRKARGRDTAILLGFGGLAGYIGYLQLEFGRPLLFIDSQRYWGQQSGTQTLLKSQYWWELTHFVHRSLELTTTVQAFVLLAGLVLVPFVGRRFGWGYAVFQLVLVAMPAIGSKDFMGVGRYLMVLFPTHALIGEWLSGRSVRLRTVYFAVSGTGLVVLAAAFAHGVYLS